METRNILRVAGLAVLILASSPDLRAQNLYLRAKNPPAPIDDHRAARVGDILTVLIQETSKIKNKDKINRKNETNLGWRLEQYTLDRSAFNTPLPAVDSRTERNVIADVRQEADVSLTARIAVVVIDVQPNGNLVVAGTRLVQMNDETKTLKMSGLVRALDVKANNTVASSQVADARVSLTGEGGSNLYLTRGPAGMFFDTLIWAAWPF
ncbi:MAG: flagellar basal body L-ring protein FlgH [Planctomycetota bacterium]